MKQRNFLICFVLINIGWLILSCQPRRKGVHVGGDDPEMVGTLNGLDDEDKSNKAILFELSGCVDLVSGVVALPKMPTDPVKVSFKARGLKKGLKCDLMVRNPGASTQEIKFLNGDVDGLLYEAAQVPVEEDLQGQLIATFDLQKTHVKLLPDPKNYFSLTVPVNFPVEEKGKVITAALDCQDVIPQVGVFTVKDAKSGSFKFDVGLEAGLEGKKKYQCTSIVVGVDGIVLKYKGIFPTDSGKFEAGKQDNLQVPSDGQIVLALVTTPTAEGISVETSLGQCKDTEVFNTITRQCEPKK